jgi:phage terminase large subunit-like protein
MKRVVRRALLILPEGCGKTALVSAISLAELAGHVVMDQSGKRRLRKSPNIIIAAASLDNANRLYGAATAQAGHENSKIRPYLDIQQRTIKRKQGPGTLTRIAAEATTNVGGLPTCFLADELQSWEGRKASVHLVISNSLTKREGGLEIGLTTPDAAEPDSLLANIADYGKKVATGEIVDPSFLFLWYTAHNNYDLNDPDQLRAAIAEATPASWLNHETIAARLEVDRIPVHEFERFKLARFRRATKFWLPGDSWEPLVDEKRGLPAPGTRVVIGFDGSYARDASALVCCEMDGHISVLDVWERPPKAPHGWNIPRSEVDAAVHKAMETWQVAELVCDPHRWTQEIQDWEQIWGGETVIHFPTSTITRMAPACSRFYSAVVTGKGISHDGNPVLTRHLYNAVTREYNDGAIITKEHRDSPKKIDAAVAAVMAYDRAMILAGIRPPKSMYELGPPCDCHGVPQVWFPKREGGSWGCRVTG